MEYIITFAISIIFAQFANLKSNNRVIFYLFSIFSVLLPIVIAGARDRYVGTDTGNYYLAFDRAIMSNSYQDLISKGSTMEFGFQIFTYLCSRITNDRFILMSLFHAMIILPVYAALTKWKDKISPAYGLFVFYFMFYCMTLNTTRQGVALSFSLLSFSYLLKLGFVNWKSIFFGCIAISFHNSAYLIFLIFGLYYVTKRYSLKDHLCLYLMILCLLVLGLYLMIEFFNILSVIENERDVYSTYLNNESEGAVSKSSFLFYCFVNYLVYKVFDENDDYITSFFLISSLFASAMVFLAIYNPTFRRLGLYFSIFEILSIPMAIGMKNGGKKIISRPLNFVIVIFIVIMWFFSIVIRGSHETYPYHSTIF